MLNQKKDTQVNFKTNAATLSRARRVFAAHHLDTTTSLNLFLDTVAEKGELPFETLEDRQRSELIRQLQKETQQGFQEAMSDKGLTLDEARERLGL